MSWKRSKIASSLMSLFVESAPEPAPNGCIQDIRQAMLDCLSSLDANGQTSLIFARVRRAPDLQALWYLRADVMVLLASVVGESRARTQLQPITHMFVGLLPAAQRARPSRLHR